LKTVARANLEWQSLDAGRNNDWSGLMAVRVCRWGVLGTATIARKFWNSVRLADNSHLIAVASRDETRSANFIREGNSRFPVEPLPLGLGSYRELVEHPDVDAVYIPLPTGLRAEWVRVAAENGKHVLCEKPCATSVAELESMIASCESAGVQFMDNVMMMHSARLERMKQILNDDIRFGDLRRIASQFSFCAPDDFFRENIRNDSALEPWGCLGDLGWYNIRIALWALDNLPGEVVARFGRKMSPSGPPAEISGEMFFADGVSASFYCSFLSENQQWVHFTGTRGTVTVDDFALPWFGARTAIRLNKPVFNESGWDFNYEQRETVETENEYSNSHFTAQEVQLVRNFAQLVLDGKTDSYWPRLALNTQLVMESIMESARGNGLTIRIEGEGDGWA
jgi:predicted dehydrogenase